MRNPNSPWNARLPALFFIVLTVIFSFIVSRAGATEPQGIHMVPIPRGLEKVAVAYWAERGVGLPPNPVLIEMVPEPGIGGRAEYYGRTVWLPPETLYADRRALCQIYIHERGHNAGLTHSSPFQIMYSPWAIPFPPKCVKWAWI